MKQYGDITKLHGYDLDPVDLIVGGSPCQDLSVAGKRAGLDGELSGLFLEMIRIIREMREKTNGIYPRYALWENVPGAFSSNNGKDFGAVLGEFSRLIEPNAPDVPMPEEGYSKSGMLLGSDWSLTWRTHDAQFWGKTIRDSYTGDVLQLGTPQRRRRIALIADFRGQSAAEILFERKSLSGNTEQGGTAGQGSARAAADSIGAASGNVLGWYQNGQGECLNNQMVFDSQVHHGCKEFANGICQTITQEYGTGGNNQRLVVATMQGFGDYVESDVASSCKQRDYKDATDKVCRIQNRDVYSPSSFGNYKEGIGSSQAAGGDLGGGSENLVTAQSTQHDDMQDKCQYVRRLTPLECERLQGYPDGWTAIPGASDSSRYKALGNSIALPFWEHLAHRFAEIGGVKTIGSLFDGIGGFPLVFKRAGAECLWTSEIEPFCHDVVEYHVKSGDL